MTGSVVIGYEINKQKRYCIKMKDKCIIGSYGATFNHRSPYIYTALSDISALTIRKENWYELLSSNPEIGGKTTSKVMMTFMTETNLKMQISKKRVINDYENRKDYNLI